MAIETIKATQKDVKRALGEFQSGLVPERSPKSDLGMVEQVKMPLNICDTNSISRSFGSTGIII